MPSSKRILAVLIALLLMPLTVVASATAAQAAASGLTATFSVSGTNAKYVIANTTDAAVTGWTLEFDLPDGVSIGGVQNGKSTQDGNHVTIINEYYNATVPAGGDTEPYSPSFTISAADAPPGCKINGDNCDGSPDT
ncbi:MAG: cellulose binding domain-containing protein, partial [Stackebrandtia sp.]